MAEAGPRPEGIAAGRRFRWFRRVVVGLVLLMGAIAAAGSSVDLAALILGGEERAIAFERYWRRTVYGFGFDLPGTPDLDHLDKRLAVAGLAKGAPVLIRIFKREFELELWMEKDGRFQRFATYPVCRFSGGLGPKMRTGDRQAPEGFYSVGIAQLNPRSRWHRSFNLGFPNAFDRAHGRTGSLLMVHGGCSSAGCYAMTNAQIDEIWTLVGAALKRGQRRFQAAVFPFRMSEENLAAHGTHPAIGFWRELKPGYDLFEADGRPPRVSVCAGQYRFEAAGKPGEGSDAADTTCTARAATRQ